VTAGMGQFIILGPAGRRIITFSQFLPGTPDHASVRRELHYFQISKPNLSGIDDAQFLTATLLQFVLSGKTRQKVRLTNSAAPCVADLPENGILRFSQGMDYIQLLTSIGGSVPDTALSSEERSSSDGGGRNSRACLARAWSVPAEV